MTDMPERIWAVHHETQGAVMIGEWGDTIRHIGGTEYIRADLCGPAAQGWQPIETAPKDGARVDFWTKDGHRICDCNSMAYDHSKMSHWMPLPAPPAP